MRFYMEKGNDNLFKKLEWACFKMWISNNLAHMNYVNPRNPTELITYKDIDKFTDFKTAIDCSKTNNLNGIITREAIEYITYVNIRNSKDYLNQNIFADEYKNLNAILESSKNNPERFKLIFINPIHNDTLLKVLIEAMNEKTLKNDSFTYKNINFYT